MEKGKHRPFPRTHGLNVSIAKMGHPVSQETRNKISCRAIEQNELMYHIRDSDKDRIIQLYTVDMEPIYKIAKSLGYTFVRVKKFLIDGGISIRTKSEAISFANRRNWKNLPEEERNRRINMWVNAGKRAVKLPNKSELLLWSILYGAVPGEYEYTGWQVPGKSISIGGLRPDFFHIGHKKKVIEFFGSRFHPIELSRNQTEKIRKDVYKKFGFDCLIIWDYQLRNIMGTATRVMQFNRI